MFTQVPPVQGSTLATDYVDICLASCLMSLGQCVLTLRLDRGAHQTQPDHFSLVEEVSATSVNYQESFCKYLQPSSPPQQSQRLNRGFRCLCLYIDHDRISLGLRILVPGVFVFLQACFWLRVVSVDNKMSA